MNAGAVHSQAFVRLPFPDLAGSPRELERSEVVVREHLGVILGPLAETNFMTTMISFNNDWTVFFTRPVSGPIMAIGVFTLVYPVIRHLRHRAGGTAAGNAGKQ